MGAVAVMHAGDLYLSRACLDRVPGAGEAFQRACRAMTRSLNLAVVAAVMLARGTTRRRQALGRAGDLDDGTRLRLRACF